ncbi:hypothetical protein A1O7_08332 [Cladophialophora yegresii CBS 114405]|uniref:RING-type domain-containing protein n=1 Tax=Cladophialophora yegresii CBS 114405 TaxID=1182544 RepID=W9VQX3_9EURO|nr:uncharacterized protein A1O7_08332 [Cladophialophora yegresii CBS 114405]EXJ55405.1 hypothetical protein A1O7_08332 [Cladophialophora yegresii CBS 114405]
MDQYLRCNNQVNGGLCRAVLRHEAIVTTCAQVPCRVSTGFHLTSSRHIFCTHCADKTGLTGTPQEQRQCPACKSDLPNPHDVVRNLSRPPDDYKTSVLAGLDPTTIVECAQKALNFWTYQNTQEHAYQQCIAKHLMQKCQQLRTDADRIVHDANTRIEALEAQVQGTHNPTVTYWNGADVSTDLISDRQSMDQKYADLFRQYQEKSKKQQQTQKLYDAIKQKVQVEKMGVVANNDVDHTLDSIRVIPPLDEVQHDRESRQGFRVPEHRETVERVIQQYMPVQGELERLHPHQRSGSSVAGSQVDHLKMPPPGGPRASRIPNLVTSGTPTSRATLPAITRLTVNRAQIPTSASRPGFAAGQTLTGSSRRQPNQATKMPGSAQNSSAVRFGSKFGGAGIAGSLDGYQHHDHHANSPIQHVVV